MTAMDPGAIGLVLAKSDLAPVCMVVITGFAVVVALIASAAEAARERKTLELLAAALEGGQVSGRGVTGRHRGRELGLRLDRRDKKTWQVMTLRVPNAPSDFEVAEAGILDGLFRWMGLQSQPEGVDQDLVIRGRRGATERLFQHQATRRALRALIDLPEFDKVTLRDGVLRVERRLAQLEPDYVLRVAGLMSDLADLFERREVKVVVRAVGAPAPGPRFAWTGGGEQARCPYCRDDLAPDGPEASACSTCGTLHHAACLEEAGGCTVFACRGGPRSDARSRAG